MLPGVGNSKKKLEEQARILETVNGGMEAKISDLRDRNRLLQEAAASAEKDKEALQLQVRELSHLLDTSKTTAHGLQSEKEGLERQVHITNRDALESKAKLETLTSDYNTLHDSNNKLQERVAYLDQVVAWVKVYTGSDAEGSFEDYAALKETHNDMASKLQEKEELCSRLALDMKAMETKNAALTQSLEKFEEAFASGAAQPPTLRYLLTSRLVEASFVETDETSEAWWPKELSPGQLDKSCGRTEFRNMVNLLPRGPAYNCFYRRLELSSCEVCSRKKLKFKFDVRSKHRSLLWLHEFTGKSTYFSCCYEKVCKNCFLLHMAETLKYKWWCKLGSLKWFICPRSGCGGALGIRCEADLQICLERNGDADVEKHVQM